MQGQQLDLWSPKQGELQSIHPLYQELTPDQRHQIIKQLARLILNQVRHNTNRSTATKDNDEQ